jgi:hypothetical protein
VLVSVYINPEGRVKVEQGEAKPDLLEQGARLFLEEGVKPRRGARWHGLTVNKILAGKGRKGA